MWLGSIGRRLKSMSESLRRFTNTQIEVKDPIRKELGSHLAAYLASGGQITEIAPGITGYKPPIALSEADKQQRLRASNKAREINRQKALGPMPIDRQKRSRTNYWTAEEDALLVWLRAGGIPYSEILPLLTRIPRTVNGAKLRHGFLAKEF